MSRPIIAIRLVLAAIMLLSAGGAVGQTPFVAPEFYNGIRPDFGNRLPLCVLPDSATAAQDREAAALIAEVMLLEPDVVELDVDLDMLDETGVWPVIFEELARSCVGVMGVQIIPGETLPDWMTLSRPYFEAPYVLLTRDPDHKSLADLPAGARLGVPLYTPIDAEVMLLIAAGGPYAGLRRLPYDRPALIKALMEAGELDAAIAWMPHLETPELQPVDFYAAAHSTQPLHRNTRALAVLLRSQDEMLRTMIDEAIGVLDAEGALPDLSDMPPD